MEKGMIHSIKLSSVGPADVKGPDVVFGPENIDLAMKLHYLRGIYYFRSPAFAGFTVLGVKEPLFSWLNQFPVPCGRFRRADSGRAFIKCNDCGTRLIQGMCDTTLDEWMEMVANKGESLENILFESHFVGPELQFSPLVYLQINGVLTRDANLTSIRPFSLLATNYFQMWSGSGPKLGPRSRRCILRGKIINMFGRAVSGFKPDRPINPAQKLHKPSSTIDGLPKAGPDPVSIKRVDPVGDNWVYAAPCKMESFSFHVTAGKLSQLRSKLAEGGGDFPPFEALSAVIWQSVARVRADPSEARVVNVFRKGEEITGDGKLGNTQIVSVVKLDSSAAEASPSEQARLVRDEAADDRRFIDEAMEREGGLTDFVAYGANLSFVNLEEAPFYDFECKGERPIRAVYRVDGVGEKGAVLVLPTRAIEGGAKGGGRLGTLALPENEVAGVMSELKSEGLMA